MANEIEVKAFLEHLKAKIRAFNDPVSFENREKNTEAMAELDILPIDRLNYLKNLSVEDYFTGPNPDEQNPGGPPYFEFGINVKGQEVYVKLTLGKENKRINCISFHKSERPITYPFKK